MAVSTPVHEDFAGANSTNSITSGSFTPAASDLVLCAVSNFAAAGAGTCTFSDTFGDTGGSSWSSFTATSPDGINRITLGYRTIGTSPSAGTVTGSLSSSDTRVCITSTTTDSHDTTTPIVENLTGGADAATSWSETYASGDANNLEFACTCLRANEDITPGTDWTELDDSAQSPLKAETQYEDDGGTNAGASWTSAKQHAHIAVEIAAAAAGGNAPTGHLYGPLVGPLGGPI